MLSLNNIRLDPNEQAAIHYALQGVQEEVYVFGSRIDLLKKGGDIDLLVFSKQDPLRLSRAITQKFFFKCEEKIDVLVFDREAMTREQLAFLHSLSSIRIQ